MSDDYARRNLAVEDGIRLVRLLHSPDQPASSAAFQSVKITRPPLDLFDVLEVARFLLDIDDVPPGPREVTA